MKSISESEESMGRMRRIQATICITTFMIFFASPPRTKAQGGPAVTTGFAEVENGKLYYEIAGDGPAVVLIHGGQLDCRMWDEQFALLAPHYRMIRFDVRGFGKSPAATRPYA
jgi:alpha-beta hydrolase superfamily lysophospholipase